MKSEILFFIELAVSFLPFILFAFFNSRVNVKKEVRNRQYGMFAAAIIYSIVLVVFFDRVTGFYERIYFFVVDVIESLQLYSYADMIRDLYTSWGIYVPLVLFNTAALLGYVIIKRILTWIMGWIPVAKDSLVGSVVELFYAYDTNDDQWYIREHYGQARTFVKSVYYGSCLIAGLTLLVSCYLCMENSVNTPFYPVFAVIIIGEAAFFIDGLEADEKESQYTVELDRSKHMAMYSLLRKPLRVLFGDKLSAEGTTVNEAGSAGDTLEDVLVNIEKNGGHIGENYAAFIRKKAEGGLKPNVDYVRSGYELAAGRSLLFNTPFYDKLKPYAFYAINRELLTGGKVMVVLGRHGTEEDLFEWCEKGLQQVTNVPNLWKIAILSSEKKEADELPNVGIMPCSCVHDLEIHKKNLEFLKKVSFVVLVEPSRLVTTAQIGLNLLIKNCGKERDITFCSVDRNCDGLVDALSHILMTNITEVSATEYPRGMSSYMYWTADSDYLHHRILPGISRYLGIGTELSMVALKNQVKETAWYGGDKFPVQDVRWIAKQYYHDLMKYAQLPANQETFDRYFHTSFNMCNEKVKDNAFITVEDDRNNLFESRRNFATIAEKQGFVNVVSSEYMLREYMAVNTNLFTTDAKAIPYITADYARTKRNAILSLCLLLCIDSIQEDLLHRQMIMLCVDTKDPVAELWKELCIIFSDADQCALDKKGNQILRVTEKSGRTAVFEKDKTILFKRAYSVENGKFESIYTIENPEFIRIIIDDLQNASYIAEQESKDIYIGTELKGHVYQKYLPGQFFTLNGKYYEMISTTVDNRILVRRASDHINGRLSYRQIRNYSIQRLEDSDSMGTLKTVNGIDIHHQYADFCVETPGYWKLGAYNDFDNGTLVTVNGVPIREYHYKQILKIDFTALGELFTDEIRFTLTNLLNETFVTLFADNQPFISAVTPGNYEAPLTYSLTLDDSVEVSDKCIFIVEDSQLDIGLLIAVERNINRIFQIITDYLNWNEEEIVRSRNSQNKPEKLNFDVYEEEPKAKKKCFLLRIVEWFKELFKRKPKEPMEITETDTEDIEAQQSGEPQAEVLQPDTSDNGESVEKAETREQKKLARAAAKAEKKAARAAARAEKKAARQQKKAEKQEERRRKKQEREASAGEEAPETNNAAGGSEEAVSTAAEVQSEVEVKENE